jgi:hypothetical protein
MEQSEKRKRERQCYGRVFVEEADKTMRSKPIVSGPPSPSTMSLTTAKNQWLLFSHHHGAPYLLQNPGITFAQSPSVRLMLSTTDIDQHQHHFFQFSVTRKAVNGGWLQPSGRNAGGFLKVYCQISKKILDFSNL